MTIEYNIRMETKVLNYRILVEKEESPRRKKMVYVAYCPKLGISDWGSSIDETLLHMQEAIECHIESLVKHGEAVPASDVETYMVTTANIRVPQLTNIAYA